MGWCSLSQKLINRSPDLLRLRADKYDIETRGGFLLAKQVPYVNARRQVLRGTLVAKLVLAGDVTTRPENHVVHFIGEYPCNAEGKPIEQIRNSSETKKLAEGVEINHTFSANPRPIGYYKDYYALIFTYCSILSGPAKVIEPLVTAKPGTPVVPDEEDNYIFNYVDTASSRSEIDVISQKLELARIAILGLGGTGAYVLDLVSKTLVREIHLFDKDVLLTHNAFRSPGAPSLDELRTMPLKVEHFASIYGKMHRGIKVHKEHIDSSNVELLRDMSFVFLCLDDGGAKKLIVQKLEEFGIPFVDVGMGVYLGETGLGGVARVTASTPRQRAHVQSRIPFAEIDVNNEYSQNIQIADLNALNAALAVIKWKKLFGFYMDFVKEHHSSYGIEVQLLTKENVAE